MTTTWKAPHPGEWIKHPEIDREVTVITGERCKSGAARCLWFDDSTFGGNRCSEHQCSSEDGQPIPDKTTGQLIWVDRTTWPIARLTR